MSKTATSKTAASKAKSSQTSKSLKKLGLDIESFKELGPFASAGLEATRLALERASQSLANGRIPISGAIVERMNNAKLRVVSVGHNGRIPAEKPLADGYPTDHGETAAIRAITDASAVNWDKVVFATSLNPCVMCTTALTWLHGLGLRNVVIAESSSFGGAGSQLEQLEGMQVLNLSNAYAQSMMKTFATRFPWDWAADIGEIPPKDLELSTRLLTQSWELRLFVDKISEELTKLKHTAAVIDPRGELLASSADERKESGGNETRSAVMLALGRAGSKVNLRECVLFFMGSSAEIADFGTVSAGACQLFRPALVVTTAPPSSELEERLTAYKVPVKCCQVEKPVFLE